MTHEQDGRDSRQPSDGTLPPAAPETAAEIRALRRRLGFNQTDFARTIGVSQTTIKHWEEGSRRPSARRRERLNWIAYHHQGSLLRRKSF
jgi:DNA-binding transcriptional regulator YiaG